MTTSDRGTSPTWHPLHLDRARDLVDARLQLHHAAQLATAIGISYLPRQSDDSHTNLEWLADVGALASHSAHGAQTVRLAVRPHPFALLALDNTNAPIATLLLNGRTIDGIVRWIRSQLEARGLDSARYTLNRHYQIPPHPVVTENAPFNATASASFEELSSWFSDASNVLNTIVAETSKASTVRCWPHHFDIATLIEVLPKHTISLGMEPGDADYAEPYLYATMYPSPKGDAPRPELDGGGSWHTKNWIGAVLPGSQMKATGQQEQFTAFLRSAMGACATMLRRA